MAFIVENGSGILDANALASVSFVTNYLTDRGRETENSWSTATTAQQQQAIVAATDYMEGRFRDRYKGQKEFLSLKFAKGTLTFVGNPSDAETVVVGGRTYTFNTVLGGADSILIGASASASLDNLIAAINNTDGEGVTYGTGTAVHPDVTASAFEGDTLIAEAKSFGLAGNSIATTTTVSGASWSSATLIGGNDVGRRQPLSFPRVNLLDRDGVRITGVPDRIKQAVAEYAVRARASTLQPDLTTDVTGGQVIRKRERVGPIEEETQYLEGGRIMTFKPYPAADVLIDEFLQPGGLLIRA